MIFKSNKILYSPPIVHTLITMNHPILIPIAKQKVNSAAGIEITYFN